MENVTRNIAVIGLGLIGGSLSLNIRETQENVHMIGYDINKDQLHLAKSLGVIDEEASSIECACEKADIIIIAVPVTHAVALCEKLASLKLKKGVIITDVGSTKTKIVETANIFAHQDVHFIGGHPMAGSHKSGVAAAKVHLFENAYYILTPSEHTPEEKVSELKQLLQGTKAQLIEMTPSEHDRVAGVISHFPHIIAASLVHQAKKYKKQNGLTSKLAAGGFRDITRIASSSPVMWRDILIHNQQSMLELFDEWALEMEEIKEMVRSLDAEGIFNYFEEAKNFRDGLPVKEKGAIPSFYDLYVDVPDYPGIISEVTGYLAEERISITNLRILETREDIYGVLRLSLQKEEDREKARICLESHGYGTFIPS